MRVSSKLSRMLSESNVSTICLVRADESLQSDIVTQWFAVADIIKGETTV